MIYPRLDWNSVNFNTGALDRTSEMIAIGHIDRSDKFICFSSVRDELEKSVPSYVLQTWGYNSFHSIKYEALKRRFRNNQRFYRKVPFLPVIISVWTERACKVFWFKEVIIRHLKIIQDQVFDTNWIRDWLFFVGAPYRISYTYYWSPRQESYTHNHLGLKINHRRTHSCQHLDHQLFFHVIIAKDQTRTEVSLFNIITGLNQSMSYFVS